MFRRFCDVLRGYGEDGRVSPVSLGGGDGGAGMAHIHGKVEAVGKANNGGYTPFKIDDVWYSVLGLGGYLFSLSAFFMPKRRVSLSFP